MCPTAGRPVRPWRLATSCGAVCGVGSPWYGPIANYPIEVGLGGGYFFEAKLSTKSSGTRNLGKDPGVNEAMALISKGFPTLARMDPTKARSSDATASTPGFRDSQPSTRPSPPTGTSLK